MSFPEFVRAHGPSLLATAYLLTGDRGLAADLLQATLIDVQRNWARIDTADPLPVVRRLLVARHTSWRGRVRLGELLTSTPTLANLTWPGTPPVREQPDELTAALGRLAPRTRAALVLRYGQDLSTDATADALGCPAAAVVADTDRGLAELGTTGVRLTGHLRARAARVRTGPEEVLTAALEGAHTQRGHRAALLALAAVLVVIGLLVWVTLP